MTKNEILEKFRKIITDNDDLHVNTDRRGANEPIKGDIYFDGIETESFLLSIPTQLIEEIMETIQKKIEIGRECQCPTPHPEMNRCLNCHLVIENQMTSQGTLQDITALLQEKLNQLKSNQ